MSLMVPVSAAQDPGRFISIRSQPLVPSSSALHSTLIFGRRSHVQSALHHVLSAPHLLQLSAKWLPQSTRPPPPPPSPPAAGSQFPNLALNLTRAFVMNLPNFLQSRGEPLKPSRFSPSWSASAAQLNSAPVFSPHSCRTAERSLACWLHRESSPACVTVALSDSFLPRHEKSLLVVDDVDVEDVVRVLVDEEDSVDVLVLVLELEPALVLLHTGLQQRAYALAHTHQGSQIHLEPSNANGCESDSWVEVI